MQLLFLKNKNKKQLPAVEAVEAHRGETFKFIPLSAALVLQGVTLMEGDIQK